MTNEEIKSYINAHLPEANFDETGEWLNVLIDPNSLLALANALRGQPMQMDYLFNLTCVDWKTHLTMVYHLTSSANRNINIVLKANLDYSAPNIETVCSIWRTAEMLEREVFEMFGVVFANHPDLRKLILEEENPAGFDKGKGYWPLRKDFEDPINMIKL
jgi:NADH:ubiquinone oxidoreductase subunit C